MLKKEDKELVEKLIKKDKRTLYRFYKKTKKPLLNFVLKTVKVRQDAEEVVQDAFLDFVEGLRDFRGQSSPKTFLFAIARNKAIDKLRRKKLKRILFSYLPQSLVESISAVLLDDEIEKKLLTQKINQAFNKLPNDYAAVLRLKYKEGYKVAEMAEKLKLSFKATESLLFRARKAFVKVYEKSGRQELPKTEEET